MLTGNHGCSTYLGCFGEKRFLNFRCYGSFPPSEIHRDSFSLSATYLIIPIFTIDTIIPLCSIYFPLQKAIEQLSFILASKRDSTSAANFTHSNRSKFVYGDIFLSYVRCLNTLHFGLPFLSDVNTHRNIFSQTSSDCSTTKHHA